MEIVIGTAQLFGTYGFLGQSVSTSGGSPETFLRLAQELGFTAIDTAPVYPGAEEAIARAELSLPIHTKLDPRLSPEDSINGSLKRLNRHHVDVVYLHDEEQVVRNESMAVVRAAELVGSFAGMLGTSIYTLEALNASLAHPAIGLIQIPVNPMHKVCVDRVSQFVAMDKKILGRSLLNQGLLACSSSQIPRRMLHLWPAVSRYQQICSDIGRTPVEVAILWARDHPVLDGIIVGAVSIDQLEEIEAISRQPSLSNEERAAVDALEQPSSDDMDPRRWK